MDPMEPTAPQSVVMVAGEASGDLHGAHVIRALKKRHDDIFICGAGGSAMRSAGARIIVDVQDLSVMGFSAIFSKIPAILKAAAKIKRVLSKLKPDLLILIDFPDFNLHLAAYAKRTGIPVLYYISPQVWAWRSGRIHKIKARVDHMAVILPFEKSIYEQHQIPVSFVGHPLMDAAFPQPERNIVIEIGQKDVTVSLLPGSREGEVRRLLPAMLEAAEHLQANWTGMQFLLSCAPTIDRELLSRVVKGYPALNLQVSTDPVTALFKKSHLSIVASGTASLEAAIYGIPAIIVYSTSRLNYAMAKRLINVSHIGLANLIAQRRVIPELIQGDASAAKIAAAALDLLTDPSKYGAMQEELREIRKRLGGGGASDRVADIACRLMANRSKSR
jgi:lipid-A-disaccharide synthase